MGEAAELAKSEALSFTDEFRVITAKEVKSGSTEDEESAGLEDPREFGEGELLVAEGEMRNHIERDDGVEGGIGERKSGDGGLGESREVVADAAGIEVERSDAPVVAIGKKGRHEAGAAASFENMIEFVIAGDGIEQAKENRLHAAVPPEVALGGGDVGEFGGIHIG